MSYSPIDPSSILHPGMLMSTAIGSMGTNINEAWFYAMCPQAYACAQSFHSGAGTASTFYWVRLRGNADQATWRFRVFCRALHNEGAGQTNNVRVLYEDDSNALDDAITVVSSTGGEPQEPGSWYGSTITISDDADPLDLRVQLYTSHASNHLHALAFMFYLEPYAAAGANVLDSGFVRWNSNMNATNDPITSEHVNRLIQAPYKIARDRPATLYSSFTSYYDEDGNTKSFVSTVEDTYQTVLKHTFRGDGFSRTYRIDAYLLDEGRADDTDMSVRIIIDGAGVITFTGRNEWKTDTFVHSGESISFIAQIKNDEANDKRVSLPTLLIRREPG